MPRKNKKKQANKEKSQTKYKNSCRKNTSRSIKLKKLVLYQTKNLLQLNKTTF